MRIPEYLKKLVVKNYNPKQLSTSKSKKKPEKKRGLRLIKVDKEKNYRHVKRKLKEYYGVPSLKKIQRMERKRILMCKRGKRDLVADRPRPPFKFEDFYFSMIEFHSTFNLLAGVIESDLKDNDAKICMSRAKHLVQVLFEKLSYEAFPVLAGHVRVDDYGLEMAHDEQQFLATKEIQMQLDLIDKQRLALIEYGFDIPPDTGKRPKLTSKDENIQQLIKNNFESASELPSTQEQLVLPDMPEIKTKPLGRLWYKGMNKAPKRNRVSKYYQKCLDILIAKDDEKKKAREEYFDMAFVKRPRLLKYIQGRIELYKERATPKSLLLPTQGQDSWDVRDMVVPHDAWKVKHLVGDSMPVTKVEPRDATDEEKENLRYRFSYVNEFQWWDPKLFASNPAYIRSSYTKDFVRAPSVKDPEGDPEELKNKIKKEIANRHNYKPGS